MPRSLHLSLKGKFQHPCMQRVMDLAQENRALSWLTSLPQKEFNLALHNGAFLDAVALRYGWVPNSTSTHCSCGSSSSTEHTLSCLKGDFPVTWHNEVCGLPANLMTEVCHDVYIEPVNIYLEPLSSLMTVQDWMLQLAGFGMVVKNMPFLMSRSLTPMLPPTAQPISTCCRKHKNSKKQAYVQYVHEVECGSFTPLFCLQQEAWEMLPLSAIRGWLPWLLPNMISSIIS